MISVYTNDRPETFNMIEQIHKHCCCYRDDDDDEEEEDDEIVKKYFIHKELLDQTLVLGFHYCRMYSIREDNCCTDKPIFFTAE